MLKRPEVQLHTNGSESDIRDYVKKKKVSDGTRSDEGRRCGNTFASLKKTCRKFGVSFWKYLSDRLAEGIKNTPSLPDIIIEFLDISIQKLKKLNCRCCCQQLLPDH
ncbi:MAG: hypothetical protein OXD32_01925 [Endozoicomonadaceae bacterium]|nr:hypothetical protein [Endozoicomonadaceae bacterium]